MSVIGPGFDPQHHRILEHHWYYLRDPWDCLEAMAAPDQVMPRVAPESAKHYLGKIIVIVSVIFLFILLCS